MNFRKVQRFTAAIFLTACGPKIQTAPEPSATKDSRVSIKPGTETTWEITPVARDVSYLMLQDLIIINQAAANQPEKDRQTVSFTVSPDLRNPWEDFSIRITQISFDKPKPSADISVPLSAKGSWAENNVKTELNDSSTCTNAAASIFPAILPVILQIPRKISVGAQWSDSSSSSSCAGIIPLTFRTHRTYRVIGETTTRNQQRGIVLAESDTTKSSGEGADGQHYVRINGEGNGQGQIIIDPTDGTVIRAQIDSRSRISVTASGRTLTFEQQLKKEISRVN